MENVKPIPREKYAVFYTREKFQPLLDALAKDDFELAKALTPEGLRLCGYQEFPETTQVYERGIGWAGQFADVQVPAGRYPVFAREFQYHEAKQCYTNELKMYPGVLTWVEGQCVASSDAHDKYPHPYVVVASPYAHDIAQSVLSGKSKFHLIAPFEAKEHSFKCVGQLLTTHIIVDSSLPELLKENPMRFRNGGPKKAGSLDSQIEAASQKASHQPGSGHSPKITR